jgi:hypothetical protein
MKTRVQMLDYDAIREQNSRPLGIKIPISSIVIPSNFADCSDLTLDVRKRMLHRASVSANKESSAQAYGTSSYLHLASMQ